jgi:small-conductance mechanosensitive channel
MIPAAIHITLLMAVSLAFLFSKKFVNTEFNKLESRGKLDRFIILMSGIILSALTTVIFIMCLDIILKYVGMGTEMMMHSYLKLVVALSVALITSYIIATPNHPHLRFLKISDEEARLIYKKFLRIIVLSFCGAVTASFFPTHGYIIAIIMICYYFLEMTLSKKLIDRLFFLMQLKEESFSCKLTVLINQKITFICLFGMFFAVFINRTQIPSFFKIMNRICGVVVAIFLFQALISWLLNKIMVQLDSIQHGMHSQLTAIKRQKNLIWICDVIVIVFYFLAIGTILKYIGVNLHAHIFHDSIVTIGGIIFVSIVLYKGFNEFADAMLEKAIDSNRTNDVTKLKTILPTVSAIFYVILFITSTLLVLSNLKINVAPILATFTVFSAAIGLAAQDIIRSFLHGITFLIEDNLYVGAYIKVDQKEGVVEKLSTRVLHLRDDNGSVHVIPYSAINAITSYSKNYLYCKCELTFNDNDDIQKISQLLINIVEDMKKEDKYKSVILSNLEIHGLKPFDLTGPKIYWKLKTTATASGTLIKYEIFRRLYSEYQKHGMHMPMATYSLVSV